MIAFRSPLLAACLLALAAHSAPVHAQQARSFVSGLGNDGNAPNCIRTAPCRTFQVAHDNTLANGEITVLDPGSYGSVTITKTISIINDGIGEAGMLISGGNIGVLINAGAADKVSLRGITIKGIGFGGGNGIKFNAGQTLTVENCVVRNLSVGGNAIIFQPINSNVLSLEISNTFLADNTADAVFVSPTGTSFVNVVLNRVEMYNNNNCLDVVSSGLGPDPLGRMVVAVESSVAANNAGAFTLRGTPPAGGAVPSMNVVRSVIALNGTGFSADPGNTIVVGASTITGNSTPFVGNAGSWGDNYSNVGGAFTLSRH